MEEELAKARITIMELEFSEEAAQNYALKCKEKMVEMIELLRDGLGCSCGDDVKARVKEALKIGGNI